MEENISHLGDSDEPNQAAAATSSPSIYQTAANACETIASSTFTTEQDTISLNRKTESAIRDFQTQLDLVLKTKDHLVGQFAQEKRSLIEKYEQQIRGIRQKHSLCETTYKKQLENAQSTYNELEAKRAAELESYQAQINSSASELAETKRKAQSTQQALEKTIADKDKGIHDLQGEKTKLQSRYSLLEEEFRNKKLEFENDIREYRSIQEKDCRRLEQLQGDLNTSNQELSRLENELAECGERCAQSEIAYKKLKEEFGKTRDLLKLEQKIKQEKIDAIHSLTTSLNRNKSELESLRNNFVELEANRQSEVKELQDELEKREATFEKMCHESKAEMQQCDEKHREEIDNLRESLRKHEEDYASLSAALEQHDHEFQSSKQQYERKITKLEFEKKANTEKIARLDEQLRESLRKRNETDTRCESLQKELSGTKALLESAEAECGKRKDRLFDAQEKCREIEMTCSLQRTELDECKQLFDAEKAGNKERSRQIETLKETLLSSQSELDELKVTNDKLQRAIREQDELFKSLEADRDELRNTLTEVEKSRYELKTKLDTSKYSCLSMENKLKRKEDEAIGLNRRLESLSQEKKMLLDELESAGKSLTQMKQLNEKLHEQTLSLQKRNSSLETRKFESERKGTASAGGHSADHREAEVRRHKRESEQLKEQITKLENEKRRVERSYANLEREFSILKNTSRTATALASHGRTPSPNIGNPASSRNNPHQQLHHNQHHNSSNDNSASILSITRLLADNSTFGISGSGGGNIGNAKKDLFSNEALKVTRGIEALEQQHMVIQQKVQGLENLLDAASSESDANSTRRTESDFGVDLRSRDHHAMTTVSEDDGDGCGGGGGSNKSNHNFDMFDCNGNYNDAEERLRIAQLKAQTLIEASSMFEKEVSSRTTQNRRSRPHSLRRHTSSRHDDSDDDRNDELFD